MRLLFAIFLLGFSAFAGTARAQSAPAARIAQFAGDRAAAISYTFDDNLRDQYTLAVPMLNEVAFKGTFFVIAGKTVETPEEGEKKLSDPNLRDLWGSISWPELVEMAKQGHEIASHTWSHRGMARLTPEEVDAELSKACDAIKTHIGKPALTLAFPFNQSTPEVQVAALKYHLAYRSHQASTGGKSTVASLNEWADKLVKEHKWDIMMTHAIAKGYAAMSDPEIFHEHLKYVKSRERDIWVDTFATIARYEKERDDAKLTVTGQPGSVTCVLNDRLDPQLYDVPLTIVIDAPGATRATVKRAGRDLPAHVENGAIHVEAAPGAEPITVVWK
jgi:peptidoglycan/xylan/chitin deacetylase (PgdA/CDA1 family)